MQSIKFDGFLSISLDKSAVAKTNKNKIECEMMQTRMEKEKKMNFECIAEMKIIILNWITGRYAYIRS